MSTSTNRRGSSGGGARLLHPPPAPPPLLLKVREVADLPRMSRSAVYSLMEREKLSYVKIGASRRVERAAVLMLIDSGRVAV